MSGYCERHDPILLAGSITCGGCGAKSYPTDADWFGDDTILATFTSTHERTCRDRREYGIVLLAPDGLDLPAVPRPRRCRGYTAAGYPCRKHAKPGSGYCHQHNPVRRPS